MKKINLLFLIIITVLFMNLISCKTENNDSAYIYFNLDNYEARTILPDFKNEQFSDFELKACFTSANSNDFVVGTWADYNTFITSRSKIEPGLYNFTLTAVCSGATFKGVLKNINIEFGEQRLDFQLELQSFPEFTETNPYSCLSYKFNWIDQENAVKEIWVYWDFYTKYEKNGIFENKEKLIISKDTNEEYKNYSIFEKNNLNCFLENDSNLIFQVTLFYETTENGISFSDTYKKSYTEIVKLLPGVTTSTEKTIDIINNLRTINYIFNVPNETKLQYEDQLTYAYQDNSSTIYIKDIKYPMKNFIGWYYNPEGTGKKVEYLSEQDKKSSVTLYAVWEDIVYTITYDNGVGSTTNTQPETYTGFDDYEIYDLEKEWYTFLGWKITSETGDILVENTEPSYTISYDTISGNIKLTAIWGDGPLGTTYNNKTSIPNYSVIYCDGTYSTSEEVKNYTERQKFVSKSRAIGIVYDSQNRKLVGIHNGGDVKLDPYEAREHSNYYRSTYNITVITNWGAPDEEGLVSIFENRDTINEIMELIDGDSICTGYFTNYYKPINYKFEKYYPASGYSTKLLGIMIIDGNIVKTNMESNFQSDSYWVKSEIVSGFIFYKYNINHTGGLSWLAVSTY